MTSPCLAVMIPLTLRPLPLVHGSVYFVDWIFRLPIYGCVNDCMIKYLIVFLFFNRSKK